METKEVKRILGGRGKKMHVHDMHLRRTQNGYIAKHNLTDQHGNPPQDGQRSEEEYNLSNPEELASHVQKHMGAQPDDEEEENS